MLSLREAIKSDRIPIVIPAKAGTQMGLAVSAGVCCLLRIVSRLRGNDDGEVGMTVVKQEGGEWWGNQGNDP